jgi:hypothetical protein
VQETRYELADGELLAFDRIAGRELACRAGELWLTIDGRPEDIILGPGQGWRAADASTVVVSALKDSLLVVTRTCVHAPRGRAEALLAALLRWRHAPLASMPATQLR